MENELLNAALDYIVEFACEDDWICEPNIEHDDTYCADNCQGLNRECVKRFLKQRIENGKTPIAKKI